MPRPAPGPRGSEHTRGTVWRGGGLGWSLSRNANTPQQEESQGHGFCARLCVHRSDAEAGTGTARVPGVPKDPHTASVLDLSSVNHRSRPLKDISISNPTSPGGILELSPPPASLQEVLKRVMDRLVCPKSDAEGLKRQVGNALRPRLSVLGQPGLQSYRSLQRSGGSAAGQGEAALRRSAREVPGYLFGVYQAHKAKLSYWHPPGMGPE